MCAAGKLVLALGAALCLAPALRGDAKHSSRSAMAQPQCVEQLSITTKYRWSPDDEVITRNISFVFGIRNSIYCCSEDPSNLVMTENGNLLAKEVINECIEYSLVPHRLEAAEYVCMDSATKCMRSVIVAVKPAVGVTTPNTQAHYYIIDQYYTRQYGNPMKVSCSGPNADRMTLTKNGQSLITDIESDTTITWVEENPDLQISEYICADADSDLNSSVIIKVVPAIYLQWMNKTIPESEFYGDTAMYRFQYNDIVDSIEVCCSGPRSVQLINGEDDSELAALDNNYNHYENFVKILIQHFEMGTSSFSCVDIKDPEYRRSLRLEVYPEIVVISPNVTKIDDGTIITIYGNPVEIICSGPNAGQLTLFKEYTDGREDVQKVNQTSVKLYVIKPNIPKSTYICEYGNTHYITRQSVDIQVDLLLELHVKLRNQLIYSSRSSYLVYINVPYGDSIDIFCSGPGTVQLIRTDENNNEIAATNVNKKTIKTTIAKLTLGTMEIACVNREDTYYKSPQVLTLEVAPRLEVTSFHIVSNGKFFIPFGNSLEIICSCSDAKQLILREDDTIINDTHAVNETAITWSVNKPSMSRFNEYRCSVGAQGASSHIYVEVDVLPEPAGFHCVAHDREYLNCSWTVLSNRSNFTFPYLEDGTLTHICVEIKKNTQSKYCVWSDSFVSMQSVKVFSFIIQSCNVIGCTNHTYSINHVSVLKPYPPVGLRVLKTRSRSAVLAWNVSRIYYPEVLSSYEGDFLYKVEYWHSGIQPLQVNSSFVSCSSQECKFLLKLPCPGVTYQVWVYQKLKTVFGEEYWSDPSVTNFYIEDEYNTSDVEDPTCSQDPLMEKEAAKYRVRVLRNVVRTEMRQTLRKKVNALKEKVKLIRSYQGEL